MLWQDLPIEEQASCSASASKGPELGDETERPVISCWESAEKVLQPVMRQAATLVADLRLSEARKSVLREIGFSLAD